MKILVDTHLLIWSTSDSGKLPGAARAVLENAANECFFSAASIWEIALKHTKHPNDIPSVKEVLHPNDGQIDLLPKSLWQLYAHYETLYEDAYTMQHSQLVAPEDKEEIREKALEAGKAFRTELASALGVKEETEAEDEEKTVSAGVDLDADGNVEVNESEETKHHGMRR